MSGAIRASDTPFAVDVEAGKTYWWCACGRSKNQPFCDGSHKGSEFEPIAWKADDSKQMWLCGCKNTANAPFCDGSHKRT